MSKLTASDLKQLPSGVMRLKPFGHRFPHKGEAWLFQSDEFLFVVNENKWAIHLPGAGSTNDLVLPSGCVLMYYESNVLVFTAEGGNAGNWDYEKARQIVDRANQSVWRTVQEKENQRLSAGKPC